MSDEGVITHHANSRGRAVSQRQSLWHTYLLIHWQSLCNLAYNVSTPILDIFGDPLVFYNSLDSGLIEESVWPAWVACQDLTVQLPRGLRYLANSVNWWMLYYGHVGKQHTPACSE